MPVDSNVRTNLTITDRQGLSVKLNERGPALSKKDMDSLAKAVEKHLPSAGWLLLCGSLPPGVDSRFYAHLIESATHHGVQTLLDTDGDALLYGIEAGPTLASPNQSEAERLAESVPRSRVPIPLTRPATFWRWAHSQWFCSSRQATAGTVASAAGTNEVIPPQRRGSLVPLAPAMRLPLRSRGPSAQGQTVRRSRALGSRHGHCQVQIAGHQSPQLRAGRRSLCPHSGQRHLKAHRAKSGQGRAAATFQRHSRSET